MNAKETLKLLSKQWCTVNDIMKICNVGMNKAVEIRSGLKVIRIHDFRHSYASLLINNGVNVTLVSKYLEHTKIEETLNTYSHMFSTALDSVVSVIDNLDDKS